MKLNTLPRPLGRKKKKTKRRGRGDASGQGGTAGRGHKGQKARSGGYHKVGFEGGQTPLYRRLPKRGFRSPFRQLFAIINLDEIEKLSTQEITLDALIAAGKLKRRFSGLKVLGRGKITRPVTVKAAAFSAGAKKAIEAVGGRAEVVGG